MFLGLTFDSLQCGRTHPEPTYLNRGALLRADTLPGSPDQWLRPTSTAYCRTNHSIPPKFDFMIHLGAGYWMETERPAQSRLKGEYHEQDALGNFGPSRIHPRIAFRSAPARPAIEREIADLLKANTHEPP